jgi:quercetin dioxygenase-like cupin family protein
MGNRVDKNIEFHSLGSGLQSNLSFIDHPSAVATWSSGVLELPWESTHFGFVYEGPSSLICNAGTFTIHSSMYFCIPGSAKIIGGAGMVASRLCYGGFFSIGGPVEARGRLKYIDGCSDSLLVAPVVLGDPCFNYLHLPPGIDQTEHTHPSLRVGLVVSGYGKCLCVGKEHDLKPGEVFLLYQDVPHSFHTISSDLRIVVYHPDSDFGPSDENHPMLNRTIVDGRSASEIRRSVVA